MSRTKKPLAASQRRKGLFVKGFIAESKTTICKQTIKLKNR
jgi:hypothetical protein